MRLIYCADPLEARQPDSLYKAEVAAAASLSLDYSIISYEYIVSIFCKPTF